jgi:LPPG:FO 2-phospho-L-lactate transferase
VRVCALAGGVGGAKLSAGLQDALAPGDLSVVVNTADDFDPWGLRVCPDLDTVMYTLAGVANPETGWGLAGESFAFLEALAGYGEDAWFKLGDRDLATDVLRTQKLREGETLTGATESLARALGVPGRILPMCDEKVSTMLKTPAGLLEFQEYFVRRRQRDEVLGVDLVGVEDARPTGAVLEAVSGADVIVFCPSNPVVSLGPILSVPGMRDALAAATAPKVAVSPIVGGKALKGPADRMLSSLGHEVSSAGVAALYEGLLDGMVVDRADEGQGGKIEELGMRVLATDAVMHDPPDRVRLAREVLGFGAGLGA